MNHTTQTQATAQPQRATLRRARITGAVAAAALVMLGLTACSSDPLDISCTDFLAQSQSQQLDTATKWSSPNSDGTSKGVRVMGSIYVDTLRSYCQSSNHAGNKLKDLNFR